MSADSYYKLTFDYFNQNITNLNNSKINVQVIDSNGITIFSQDAVSADKWSNMSVQLHTASNVSNSIYVLVNFGTENDKVGGQVYLANFEVEDSDENAFAQSTTSVDLNDNFYLNLKTKTNTNEISSSPAYSLEIKNVYNSNYSSSDICALGGVVNGNNNPYLEINPELQLEDSNYLALTTLVESEANLKSKFQISIDADKYYKLTFDLATIFNEIEDDSDYDYGAKISISGFDAIKNLKTNNELKSFTIYLKSSSSNSSNLNFSLVSDNTETLGTALLTHLNFTTATENEYNNASLSNLYNKTIYTISETEEAEGDESDDSSDDDSNTNTSSNTWLLVPSIITAVAVLIGVIGWAFKHVKVKKIEKIKQSNYDKVIATNHDTIIALATKRRDEQIQELNKTKQALSAEKLELENEHKKIVRQQQINANGKLTKEMEKSFKEYNSKINKLNVKIDILNEEIANKMTPDYLIAIEKQIISEQVDKKSKKK